MTDLEAIRARHSVRSYEDRPLSAEDVKAVEKLLAEVNAESGFHFQLILNEEKAFNSGFFGHYGKFENAVNYIVLAAKKGKGVHEKIGYYGAKVVLELQKLGLNTCWVGGTYKKVKAAYDLSGGERVMSVLTVGYGANPGHASKSKTPEETNRGKALDQTPEWYRNGVKAALLAPSAVNQKKYSFELKRKDKVKAYAGRGIMTDLDLGIARYFFEIGAGKGPEIWK